MERETLKNLFAGGASELKLSILAVRQTDGKSASSKPELMFITPNIGIGKDEEDSSSGLLPPAEGKILWGLFEGVSFRIGRTQSHLEVP